MFGRRTLSRCALPAAVSVLAVWRSAAAAPPPARTEAEPVLERVVAEVNGVPIFASQVEKACEADRLLLGAQGEPVAPSKDLELRRKALNLIISGELIYQAAKAEGLQVPASEIDRQLEVIRSQFASDEEFADYLGSAGSSLEQLRGEVERRLLMAAYTDGVTGDLDLDDAEARRLYDEQKDRFMGDEQIRAAQILIRVRPQDPPDRRGEARARIDEARRRALAGEDFGSLAREYSESPLASRGGDLGFFPRGRMLPEFEEVVFSVPVGRIFLPCSRRLTGSISSRSSSASRRRCGPFEEVKTELLMVLARERKDRALRERVEALRAGAEIRILDPDFQRPAVGSGRERIRAPPALPLPAASRPA